MTDQTTPAEVGDPALAVALETLVDELINSGSADIVQAAVARIQLQQMTQHRDNLLATALHEKAQRETAGSTQSDIVDPDDVELLDDGLEVD
jgi:hypothetical protein